MWIPFRSRKAPAGEQRRGRTRRKGRRGATSMEYVVMASFILLVVIAAVQSFGFSVGNLFAWDATATAPAPPSK